jgi:hypothetical protein
VRLGPDAARYILAGRGERVSRPFHLRWLLPFICGDDLRRWRIVWLSSWLLAGASMAAWATEVTGDRWVGLSAAVLLLALPGVLGPPVVRPVGVDLPAMAWSIFAVVQLHHGWWPLAVVAILIAASIKESSPVWAALWAWHPLLLVGLLAPLIRSVFWRPKLDQVTMQPNLLEVHEHPVRTAIAAHAGQWRDAWVMVAPWGICLAALYTPSWQLVAVLVVAYLQLVVATDTVRLLHTAAGPAVALAAAQVIPLQWLLVACVVHVVWWRRPELV